MGEYDEDAVAELISRIQVLPNLGKVQVTDVHKSRGCSRRKGDYIILYIYIWHTYSETEGSALGMIGIPNMQSHPYLHSLTYHPVLQMLLGCFKMKPGPLATRQVFCYPRRIRVKEFFNDFDPLRPQLKMSSCQYEGELEF